MGGVGGSEVEGFGVEGFGGEGAYRSEHQASCRLLSSALQEIAFMVDGTGCRV